MRKAFALGAALVVIAVIALATRGGDDDRAAPVAPSPPTRVAPPPVAPRAAAVAEPVAPGDLDDPTPLLDATHAAVHAVGRGCWETRTPRDVPPGQPDDTVGRLELRLRVVVAAGTARVEEAEPVTTRRLTDELHDCIVAGVATATWPAAVPDGVYELTELFRMGDYVVPERPPPPSRPPPSR